MISLLIFALAVGARLLPGARTIDDAYITYRYAQNLLNGQGFVYNPGEAVLGTTTPLYTFLMTGAGWLMGGAGAPFPQISLCFNAIFDGVVCLLLLHLGRRMGYPYAAVGTALCWAIAPFSVTFAIGGLETSLFVALLVGAAAAHIAERRILAALLGGLALLTRPDALLLVGALALDRLWERLRRRKQQATNKERLHWEILAFLIPTIAWMSFAALYFGSPIPQSIAAKSLAYRLEPEAGFVRLLQHYATPFLEHLTFGIPWIAVGLVLYPFLTLVGGRQALKANPRCLPFLVYPWLYFAVFAAANPLIFRWYMTPPLPAYYLFILIGAEALVRALAEAVAKKGKAASQETSKALSPPVRGFLAALVVLAPSILSLRDWRMRPDHGLDRPAPDMAWYKLELLYQQAAQTLTADYGYPIGAEITLAAGDVGVLGYFTQARILDTVGLNSPQSSAYYPLEEKYYVINYAIPPRLILDAKPDLIVILEVYGRGGLLKEAQFWELYRLREKISTDIYGSDGLLILERRKDG